MSDTSHQSLHQKDGTLVRSSGEWGMTNPFLGRRDHTSFGQPLAYLSWREGLAQESTEVGYSRRGLTGAPIAARAPTGEPDRYTDVEGIERGLGGPAYSSLGCSSNAPMSHGVSVDTCAIGRACPRWSVVRVQLMAEMASIAGLPGSRAWVCVSPPFSARGPRSASPA